MAQKGAESNDSGEVPPRPKGMGYPLRYTFFMSKPISKRQWLERCAMAFDKGFSDPEVLEVIERRLDLVMRLLGGQFDNVFQLLELEKHRTGNFYRTLAADTTAYQGIELLALLRHPCQACATDPNAWHTRWGFCDHDEDERGETTTGYAPALDTLEDAIGRYRACHYPAMTEEKAAALDALRSALDAVAEGITS